MPLDISLQLSKSPIDFEECRSKFKVTGVKTLSFLAHFWLVQTKYQNHSLQIAVKVPINHLLVSSKNPIDFEECRSKVKVTGVKTLSFLAHFWLVRTLYQNYSLQITMKVLINHLLVSSKNPNDLEECRSKVKVTGVKTLSFLTDFRLIQAKSQILLHGLQLKCRRLAFDFMSGQP